MNVIDMQRALMKAGFDVGPSGADGIWGRFSISAMKDFQKSIGLIGGGVPGPMTLAALAKHLPAPPIGTISTVPVWYAEAKRRMGLHETRNKTALWGWLKSDGRQLGDPSKLPWCGDFVDTAIARTLPEEPMLANPYWAQNWAKFGRTLDRPALGAILVFARQGGGHVGFCAGADPGSGGYFAVLGGNQSNAVSIMRLEKSRLVRNGIRWPKTAPLPTSFTIASAQGAISTNEA